MWWASFVTQKTNNNQLLWVVCLAILQQAQIRQKVSVTQMAYILLQLWGPSMLPAVVALVIHNGTIIGHLIGRQSSELKLRPDAIGGFNRYIYEVIPRLYRSFLAFLLYRWEIIMRETAILGILGITTLGFYVDSAIQELRFDRAMILILITALLNIAVDSLARAIRRQLQLRTTPTTQTPDQP